MRRSSLPGRRWPTASSAPHRTTSRRWATISRAAATATPTTFPPECYAHCHQLKPELAKKVTDAFSTFHFGKTSLADRYAVSGQTKFVPISYKTDWAGVRAMEDTATQLVTAK